jgi:hypothetical protein
MIGKDPIPSFLAGTLAVMRFARRAGEWDLELPPKRAAELPVAQIAHEFAETFPWAAFHTFDGHHADGVRSWRVTAGDTPAAWLAEQPADAYGFEAALALALAWRSETGEIGESWLPGSGRLQFDRESTIITLTIWPNLFTNEVPLYVSTEHGHDAHLARWDAAAHSNRARLGDSLRRWEARSGGAIISVESELVDGIDHHGFSASATPR